MDRKELESRTRRFAIAIIRFTEKLPHRLASDVMGRQLLRSGTAVGALYREAARAETRRDFIHKIGLSAKEAAESQYWIELFAESGIGGDSLELKYLKEESDELLRILIASGRTAKQRLREAAASVAPRRSERHDNPQSAIRDPR